MPRFNLTAAAALAVAAAAPLAPAIAQSHYSDDDAITVLAPYTETKERNSSGSTTRTLTSSTIVYHGDLNLTTPWGRDQLRDRVKLAAQETCERLEEIHPLDKSVTSDYECVRKAIKSVKGQMEAAYQVAYLDW